jgi:Flp pilus assembly protein TadD
VRLRKAKVYRLLGRSEAEPLYRSLLGSCLAAEAEHGLGQLAAANGDNAQAQAHLQRAERLAPTDEKIRNDLGVVYLNQRKVEDAKFEFLTAIELKQGDQLAAVNLVTLLIYQDDWSRAAELVSRLGLTPAQVTEAQARAEKLKAPDKPGPSMAAQVAVVSPSPLK